MADEALLDGTTDPRNSEAEWRAAIEGFLGAQNRKDVKTALGHIHGKSPAYESSRQVLSQLYVNYTLDNRLLKANAVGRDVDYAYLRVTQKTRKLDGPPFTDHISEALVVLAKEDGVWKIWIQTPLKVEPLDGAAHGSRS